MIVYDGRLDNGRPRITLTIESPEAASLAGDYEGLVDTGFNGFVLVSQETAVDLALKANTAVPLAFANGEVSEAREAHCRVTLGDREYEGTALIHPQADGVYYGTEFLKLSGLKLTMDAKNETYQLYDTADPT